MMSRLYVCSLARMPETVARAGAGGLVTLLSNPAQAARPPTIAHENHLVLGVGDIVAPLEGHVLPAEAHIRKLVAFVGAWDRRAPIVVHCFAGVSRSTAAAVIAACALRPDLAEDELADRVRRLSPTATPNALMIRLADQHLARGGRMIRAVERIGRGADCDEGEPFALDLS